VGCTRGSYVLEKENARLASTFLERGQVRGLMKGFEVFEVCGLPVFFGRLITFLLLNTLYSREYDSGTDPSLMHGFSWIVMKELR
jgi:hypothetical protein